MSLAYQEKLEQLGLSPAEARVYLAVLIYGPLAAPGIASKTGIRRTSVYPTICSLAEKGLIEGGLGHGSKFTAVLPEEALNALVVRERHTLAEREQVAKELSADLTPLAADRECALDDSVQVIRTPLLLGERVQRLQLEATRVIECIIKAPVVTPQGSNPAQQKAMARGVHYKGLYERAVIEHPLVQSFLGAWLQGGEEARVYDGELPNKMMIFDREIIVTALTRTNGYPASMLIRNAPFARSQGILFDYFWEQAKPLTAPTVPAKSSTKNKSTRRAAPEALNHSSPPRRGKGTNTAKSDNSK